MRYKPLKGFNWVHAWQWLWIGLLLLPIGQLFAHSNLENVRITATNKGTHVVLDLSAKTSYNVFTLDNPARVVIDLNDMRLSPNITLNSLAKAPIQKLRHSINDKGTLRLVMDLQSPMKPNKTQMAAKAKKGFTLAIDLGASAAGSGHAASTVSATKKAQTELAPSATKAKTKARARKFVVAIDPGHGGEDTGAIGLVHHLREKDVVLAVSKQLLTLINAQPGMRAFLVRSGDYYVGLRKRMTIAREQGADLFISVHADAFNDPRATGASVFVLSEKGASNEAARWLAEKENRSDLIGGVSLEDKGNVLASVLLDLSQTASQSASNELANNIMGQLGKITDLHHRTVQSAGFAVLKSPDIPSVLVELGFISNKKGEEQLLSTQHQRKLAAAILSGVKTYAKKRPVNAPDNWSVAKNPAAEVVAFQEE